MRWVCWMTIATAAAAAQGAPQAVPQAAVPSAAQAPQDALAAAQQNAERAAKEWMTRAQGLDAQLAPLLPCDAKARQIVQDVSKASDTRVTALAAYLRLEAAQAADQAAGARRLLAAEEARAPEAADERTDAALERSTVEFQSTNLAASVAASANVRPGLADARNTLGKITEIVSQRSALADQHSTQRDRGVAALRDLVAAYQAREAALREAIAAFQVEGARWSTYYSVRLTRTQAECSSTGGSPNPAPAPARKALKGKKQ
jgi:hypothetical protein